MTYQDRRIRSTIEEKVSKVRVQILSVLQRQLQQMVDRGWISGRLPVGMQRDRESLAQSAQVLTQNDQSFADIATRSSKSTIRQPFSKMPMMHLHPFPNPNLRRRHPTSRPHLTPDRSHHSLGNHHAKYPTANRHRLSPRWHDET